jgi:palmitoyl transferase
MTKPGTPPLRRIVAIKSLTAVGMLCVVLLVSGPAVAQGLVDHLASHVDNNVQQVKRAVGAGDWTLYGAGYAWHAPWRYSAKQRADQNDAALGGGFGRHVSDEAGNYHGLYALAFLDSNDLPMYMAGYNWQTYWGGRDLKLGLGYTVFLFGRSDFEDYLPLPAVLPVVSVRYSRFEILGTYVPSLGRLVRADVALFVGRINF